MSQHPDLSRTTAFCEKYNLRAPILMAPMASAYGAQGAAVFGPLDHATVVYGGGGIDQIAPQRPQPRKGALFVGAGDSRLRHRENGTEFTSPRHGQSLYRRRE
jgi:hypothetical protein